MNHSTMQLRPLLSAALIGLLVLSSALLVGCPRDVPPPDNALDSPDLLRGAIDARLQHVEDARFNNVTLEYFGQGERVRVRQLLLVERPDRLRVQTRLPGSDEIVSLLVSDGDTFSLHERDENNYYTGQPTRQNINRLLPVDLSSDDVVRVMLGSAPWDRFDEETAEPQLEWDSSRGEYELSVQRDDGNRLTMYVRHTDFAVLKVEELSPDGELVYSYTTENWEDHGAIALPSYRRFQWPDRDLDFSIDVADTELNIGFDDNLFVFPPPPGSQVIELRD